MFEKILIRSGGTEIHCAHSMYLQNDLPEQKNTACIYFLLIISINTLCSLCMNLNLAPLSVRIFYIEIETQNYYIQEITSSIHFQLFI
jgi:hypothetical protein